MATHSSVLAWRIPWTEEPGGLQSTGPQEWGVTEPLALFGSLFSRPVHAQQCHPDRAVGRGKPRGTTEPVLSQVSCLEVDFARGLKAQQLLSTERAAGTLLSLEIREE